MQFGLAICRNVYIVRTSRFSHIYQTNSDTKVRKFNHIEKLIHVNFVLVTAFTISLFYASVFGEISGQLSIHLYLCFVISYMCLFQAPI